MTERKPFHLKPLLVQITFHGARGRDTSWLYMFGVYFYFVIVFYRFKISTLGDDLGWAPCKDNWAIPIESMLGMGLCLQLWKSTSTWIPCWAEDMVSLEWWEREVDISTLPVFQIECLWESCLSRKWIRWRKGN
jgi:hypothetical protein